MRSNREDILLSTAKPILNRYSSVEWIYVILPCLVISCVFPKTSSTDFERISGDLEDKSDTTIEVMVPIYDIGSQLNCHEVTSVGSLSENMPEGMQFATIPEALSEVCPGGTVYIGKGDYSGQLKVSTEAVHIIGMADETVIIAPEYGTGVIIDADGVSLSGLSILGGRIGVAIGTEGKKPITGVEVSDIRISDSPDQCNFFSSTPETPRTGMLVEHCHGCSFSRVEVADIMCLAGGHIDIELPLTGIQIKDGVDTLLTDITIRNLFPATPELTGIQGKPYSVTGILVEQSIETTIVDVDISDLSGKTECGDFGGDVTGIGIYESVGSALSLIVIHGLHGGLSHWADGGNTIGITLENNVMVSVVDASLTNLRAGSSETFLGGYATGFRFSDGAMLSLSNLLVQSVSAGGSYKYDWSGSNGTGVALSGVAYVQVHGLRIHEIRGGQNIGTGGDAKGIVLDQVNSIKVSHVVISDVASGYESEVGEKAIGILLQDTSGADVEHLTAHDIRSPTPNNQDDPTSSTGIGVKLVDTDDIIIDNSIISECSGLCINAEGNYPEPPNVGSYLNLYNCGKKLKGVTVSSVSNHEPSFVAPDSYVFHLNHDSPCIDAGNPTSDYSLEPVPNGCRVNLGAYGNTKQAASDPMWLSTLYRKIN